MAPTETLWPPSYILNVRSLIPYESASMVSFIGNCNRYLTNQMNGLINMNL